MLEEIPPPLLPEWFGDKCNLHHFQICSIFSVYSESSDFITVQCLTVIYKHEQAFILQLVTLCFFLKHISILWDFTEVLDAVYDRCF